MKKNKTTFIMVLFFFIGLSILFYPTISSIYNKKKQSKAIVDYESILKNYDENKYQDEFKKAENYNQQLKKLKEPFSFYNSIKDYHNILNIGNNGMIGYISIDKIKVNLPIFHGISESVLSKAVGHVEGSSLPIGGIGNHSVLSAHRGLPSSTLFTDLDKLEIGDIFVINVLDRELTYEIDQIIIANPDEIKYLKIENNEDYVTLITCTPYGINTHRLLVRGKRTENVEKNIYIRSEAFKISNLLVAPLIATPIIILLLLILLFKPIKNNKKIIDKHVYPKKEVKNDKS